jgi:hypothetical protein
MAANHASSITYSMKRTGAYAALRFKKDINDACIIFASSGLGDCWHIQKRGSVVRLLDARTNPRRTYKCEKTPQEKR